MDGHVWAAEEKGWRRRRVGGAGVEAALREPAGVAKPQAKNKTPETRGALQH